MTTSRASHTSLTVARSTILRAFLILVATFWSHQALHNEGLEQLQSHLLGQTALIHLQFGADYDYRTAGVVNTLTQQVLTEAALLTLEHIRKALERDGCWGR